MVQCSIHTDDEQKGSGAFVTTQWSLALAARDRDSEAGAEALATLCQTYWYPLYAFVRRRGYDADEAQDLTQGFFALLVEREYLRVVDPHKGRFRTFLLTALDRFLIKERLRAHRLKRGGGRSPISLDAVAVEERYRTEPADGLTPEKLFARRWALTMLEQTLRRLEAECCAAGRETLFRCAEGLLTGGIDDLPYSVLAAQLHMTTNAFKVAVHRLRRRYAELLREEVSATVGSSEEIDDELRFLMASLST
jgi:DNA-directed RNA polymerase specialized sigma24 family protein